MAFYRRGRVRGWRIRRGSWWRWSVFLGAQETLLRGGNGSIFHEVQLIYKTAALLFYHSPIFFNNNEDRGWGSGIGAKHWSL
jgi:hypothetical protein